MDLLGFTAQLTFQLKARQMCAPIRSIWFCVVLVSFRPSSSSTVQGGALALNYAHLSEEQDAQYCDTSLVTFNIRKCSHLKSVGSCSCKLAQKAESPLSKPEACAVRTCRLPLSTMGNRRLESLSRPGRPPGPSPPSEILPAGLCGIPTPPSQ